MNDQRSLMEQLADVTQLATSAGLYDVAEYLKLLQRTRSGVSAIATALASERELANKLMCALENLVDAVAGEQRDCDELRKALGRYAPSAIEQADAAMQAYNKARTRGE